MSVPVDFNSEFEFFDSSDGGSPLPSLNFESSLDSPQAQDVPAGQEGKGAGSTTLRPPTDEPSPKSSQASTTESSSTKRTQGSASTATSYSVDDIVMTDDFDVKSEWQPSEFVHDEEDSTFKLFDGTVDPLSVENPFDFNDDQIPTQYVFNSSSTSPGPFTATTTDIASPPPVGFSDDGGLACVEEKPVLRGHNKGFSQHSLTQSMNGLKTSISREVSPSVNIMMSDESSPSAVFQSPSPPAGYDSSLSPKANAANPAAMWQSPALGGGHPHMPAGFHPSFGLNGGATNMPTAPGYPYASPFFSLGPCVLTIHPTPLKSRVETQIPIKMTLSALPPGIRRLHLPRYTISKPKLLAKPRPERFADMLELHTILVCTSAMQNAQLREAALQRARKAAQALKSESSDDSSTDDESLKPQDGGEVQICTGCVTRERKRAARKKIKKVEDEELWRQDEEKRIVVFNTQEIKEWQPSHPRLINDPNTNLAGTEVHIDAPMRIACYCRHHGEKLGFQVIFTITDSQSNFVAQAMSTSIMITDDHKTHTLPADGASSAALKSEASVVSPLSDGNQDGGKQLGSGNSFRLSQSSSDLPTLAQMPGGASHGSASVSTSQANSVMPTPKNLSRPPSPTALSGGQAKKRKASGSTKLPSGLTMTALETARAPMGQQPHNAQMPSAPSTAVSPFSPNLPSFSPGQDAFFGQSRGSPGTIVQPLPIGPPTPNSNDHTLFGSIDRSGSLENMAAAQLYSAPTSSHPSRAPSPNGLRTSVAAMQQANFVQALTSGLYNTMPVAVNAAAAARVPVPLIHKIIPSEGPKCGGIEVTVLGGGFYQGLEVMFGDIKATTTTFWGESSLVCLLPPSPTAGNVLVSFKQHPPPARQPFLSKPQQPVFKYLDDDEQQLMRTALTVLAHKMTGSFEDVADVARRIIGEANPAWGAGSSSSQTQQRGGGPGPGFNGFGYAPNLETQLLKVLDLLDVDDSTRKARYNLKRSSTGQTMLHLACSLGLHRFVAGLLARGAYCDLRDHGGYTALHLAALNNHPEIVRRLIYAGADATIRTLSGLTAADVARSREVIRAIRRMERHVRSRSGGSVHSRVNSANSLRSLWEPLSSTQLHEPQSTDGPTTDEESPEYSSENDGSEDEDADDDVEDGPWIRPMRRSTRNSSIVGAADPINGVVDETEADAVLPAIMSAVPSGQQSPPAAVSALKEQFAAQLQQFQHSMLLHLQNFSQLPYLPQMPNFSGMPPLPDYQAYLNSAPMMQRISSLVPNFGGSTPGSGGQTPTPTPTPKEMDGRWWDLSSLMPSSAPPPAYDELFPEGQTPLGRKQASAAQAAAEAEADRKCEMLFDGEETAATAVEEEPQQEQQLPVLLQIGRKHAITKEQQDNFRRAHAERMKRLSKDGNLFFVWIPLLVIVLCAMLYSRFPGLVNSMATTVQPIVRYAQALGADQGRVLEVV